MKTNTILVIGSSGTVGSELTRLLRAEGHRVRATTHGRATGADRVHLDLTTGEGLREAFEGVDKAFFLAPPGYADQYKLLSPLIQEAKRRGLSKVVLMTAMGANAVETSPFRRAEIELERSGIDYHIIRPNWFLQNFHTFWLQGILRHGKILVPGGRARVSFIDARDIAAVAAKLLTETHAKRDYDLTGPEAVTHDDVAAALSEVTGKEIAYAEVTPTDFKNGLVGAGVPADYADTLNMIFGFLREGYAAPVTPEVKNILGREPRGLAGYARDYKSSWL